MRASSSAPGAGTSWSARQPSLRAPQTVSGVAGWTMSVWWQNASRLVHLQPAHAAVCCFLAGGSGARSAGGLAMINICRSCYGLLASLLPLAPFDALVVMQCAWLLQPSQCAEGS